MAVVDHVTNKEVQQNGKFERQPNRFTTPFGDEEGELPVEAGRYRLLWAPVCPWANRSIIVRELMGLEDVISVGTLDPIRPDVPWSDWSFTLDEDDAFIPSRHLGGSGAYVYLGDEPIGQVAKFVYSFVLEKNIGLLVIERGRVKVGDHVTLRHNEDYDAVVTERTFI